MPQLFKEKRDAQSWNCSRCIPSCLPWRHARFHRSKSLRCNGSGLIFLWRLQWQQEQTGRTTPLQSCSWRYTGDLLPPRKLGQFHYPLASALDSKREILVPSTKTYKLRAWDLNYSLLFFKKKHKFLRCIYLCFWALTSASPPSQKCSPPCGATLMDALAHNYLNLGVDFVTIFWITLALTLLYYKHLCNHASRLIWRMWQRDREISPTGSKNTVFEDKYVLQNS